jgi:DHA2 family multidrug resistance protein
VVGPVLGGYIADNFGWEWIFFINIVPGIVSLVINYAVLHDPDYLKAQRAELHRSRLRFDYTGLGLIVLAMTCMEVILSKGQEWDWFGDPFGRVQALALGLVLGFVGLVLWERRHPAPVLNLAPFRDRNFALGGLAGYASYAMMYASAVLLPSMLQSLFGYNATWSGLVMSPAGVFAILAITLSGYLVGKRVDARWLIAGGACLIAAGSYWFSRLNIQVSPGQLVWPYALEMVGISALFPPLSVAVFRYLPPELRGAAAGIFAAMRMEGGSLGTTLGKTIVARRLPLHTSRLGEHLNPYNPLLREAGRSAQAIFYNLTGDPHRSQVLTLRAIDGLRQQQAAAMSYLDAYWLFAVLALVIIPLALVMRKSQAEAGAHIAAH